MAKNSNKQETNKIVLHGPGAEWLTRDICEYYHDKAKEIANHSTGDPRFNALCKELKERFDITETQAINIMNGYHIKEYVAFHERLQSGGTEQSGGKDDVEYLEWLAEKEERKKKSLDDYSLLDED